MGHHVPISPFRRRNVDRVKLGCYTGRRLLDGTIPNRLVYLSVDRPTVNSEIASTAIANVSSGC